MEGRIKPAPLSGWLVGGVRARVCGGGGGVGMARRVRQLEGQVEV